jgi:glucosylceramidase
VQGLELTVKGSFGQYPGKRPPMRSNPRGILAFEARRSHPVAGWVLVASFGLTFLSACQSPYLCNGPPPSGNPSVNVYVSSSAGDRLTQKTSLQFGSAVAPNGSASYNLDECRALQTIDGFGGSFLEAGMVNLNGLSSDQARQSVLAALFNPSTGAGFSAMKTVIGGTDFQSAIQQWYSYDDTEGDVTMANFSIARDLAPNGLISYIKAARAAGGQFVLEAPMDYPPDWMLYDVNVRELQDVNPVYYDALALYYLKYTQEYERNGIHIDYLSPFNEPYIYTQISIDEIQDLIRDHLGPLFEKEHATTKILLGESVTREFARISYPALMDDPRTRKYISAMAYHGYNTSPGEPTYDLLTELHQMYPDVHLWMTEICCHVFEDHAGVFYGFEQGAWWGDRIVSDLESGASAWIYWNMILNENGGPWLVSSIHSDAPGNRQEPMIIINSVDHSVYYTGLYYYLAHFSKFVRPGAVRISTDGSTVDGLRVISFRNSDGTLVSELLNSQGADLNLQLSWRNRSLSLTLPAISITTLTWRE